MINLNDCHLKPNYKSVVIKDNIEYKNVVYTSPAYAKTVLQSLQDEFKSTDTFLEPFRGDGSFYNAMRALKLKTDWCEIMEGKDFLNYHTPTTWVISNPPWSNRIATAPLLHSFDIAQHVVYLAPLRAFSTTKKWTYPFSKGFEQPTITPVSWKEAGLHYMDGTMKGHEGFMLCLLHWRKKI